MIDRHLAKLRFRDDISEEEEQVIRSLVAEYRDVPADTIFIRAGHELTVSTLLLDGLMCRYKDLLSGQRQISELHVAGDFADLHSFSLKRLDHSILTLTPCRVGIVPHDRLQAVTERYPHLTRVLWFSTNLDAAIHREWTLSLGKRNARARMANLFCELHVRLDIVGLTERLSYSLRITQDELAECLGITSVYTNRTLQELRELKVLEFRSGTVTILDLEGLRAIAEFDPGYLYLEKRQR